MGVVVFSMKSSISGLLFLSMFLITFIFHLRYLFGTAPKIAQFELSIFAHENIFQFNVSMRISFRMEVFQTCPNCFHYFQNRFFWHVICLFFEDCERSARLRQIYPLEQFSSSIKPMLPSWFFCYFVEIILMMFWCDNSCRAFLDSFTHTFHLYMHVIYWSLRVLAPCRPPGGCWSSILPKSLLRLVDPWGCITDYQISEPAL